MIKYEIFMLYEFLWVLKYWKCSQFKKLRCFFQSLNDWKRFWGTYFQYKKSTPQNEKILIDYLFPCISDYLSQTYIEPIYFYQDLWAFKKILVQSPSFHLDVGSHHKFVAFLSTIVPVTMVDIRPLSLSVESIHFKKGTILNLPFENESINSLSSLCVLEHIGLGRYGDEIDPFGTEKAVAELKRVLIPKGRLYISVPIAKNNRVCFNAHRCFSLEYIKKIFSPLTFVDMKFIVGNSLVDGYDENTSHDVTGLFELMKV